MSAEFPMTKTGKEALDKELDQLVKVDREQVKVEIAEARAHGDLKENAEYHAAKEKQSHLEGRIMDLQNKVGRARVIDPSTIESEKIVFGATVTIVDTEKDISTTYQIVGEEEAQSDKEKISYKSPLGKSLIGKEAGDTTVVRAPKGNIEYEIESVEYA